MRTAVRVTWLTLGLILGAALAPVAEARIWKNSSNIIEIEAELMMYDGKMVHLQLEGGNIAKFEIDKLSAPDIAYLKQTYPNGKAAEAGYDPNAKPKKKPKDAPPPAEENGEAKPEEAASGEMPPAETPPAEEPAAAKVAKAKAKAKASTTKAKSTAKEKAATAKSKTASKSKAPAGAKALLAKGKTPSTGDPLKFDTEASESTTIDVISLSITKPLEAAGESENTERQNSRVRLMLTDIKHQMVGLDDSRSLIVSWVDNLGTDLLKVDGKKAALSKLSLKLAPDGHSGTIDLSVPAAPASGAIKMRVRGELHIRWGKGERIEQVPSLALTKGTQASMGLMMGLIIDEVKPLDLPDTKLSLTLSSPTPTDQISKLIFSSVDGKLIPHQELGSASFGKGDKKSYQRMIGLSEAAETVSLQLYTYENFETIVVPIDLEFGVGL